MKDAPMPCRISIVRTILQCADRGVVYRHKRVVGSRVQWIGRRGNQMPAPLAANEYPVSAPLHASRRFHKVVATLYGAG